MSRLAIVFLALIVGAAAFINRPVAYRPNLAVKAITTGPGKPQKSGWDDVLESFMTALQNVLVRITCF
jgi:hypothetical protein